MTKHCNHLNNCDECAYCRMPAELVEEVGIDNLPDFLWFCHKEDNVPYGGRMCKDCDQPSAGYMVHNIVWKAAKMRSNGGLLCLPCLEKRLGRNLTLKDFMEVPLNYAWFDFDCREFIRQKTKKKKAA